MAPDRDVAGPLDALSPEGMYVASAVPTSGSGGGNGGTAPAVAATRQVHQAEAPGTNRIARLDDQYRHFQEDAPPCDVCGALTYRNGNCYKCSNCGNSLGCS